MLVMNTTLAAQSSLITKDMVHQPYYNFFNLNIDLTVKYKNVEVIIFESIQKPITLIIYFNRRKRKPNLLKIF